MQQSIKPYRRKALTFESIFIHTPGVIIAMVAGVSGNIDETKFVVAVKKLVDLYPILRSKLTWDKYNEEWIEETKFELPIRIVPRISEEYWKRVFEESWNYPIDLENGPFYEFILVRSDSKSEIIFRAHHMMTDGRSMSKILDLVLRFMNNPDMVIETASDDEELPNGKNLKKSIRPKLTLKQKIQNTWDSFLFPLISFIWKTTKLKIPKEDLIKSYNLYLDYFKHLMLIDEFSEEETSAFIKICKKHDVTVNTAMATAFLACRREIDLKHENNKQFVSVDLRRHLGEKAKKSISCYASTLTTNFIYDTSKPFWENASNYQKIIRTDLNACAESTHVINFSHLPSSFIWATALSGRMQGVPNSYKDHPYFKWLGPKSISLAAIFTRVSSKFGPSFTITNINTGNFTYDYGDLKLESCIMSPSFVIYPPFSILLSVVTINKKITISFHTANNIKDPDTNYEKTMNDIKVRYKEFITKDIFK